MKKIASVAMSTLLILGLCSLCCKHVHTSECGEKGINCTHKCHHIMPYRNEHDEF